MKYADMRASIKSGDLLAFSHAAPFYRSWYDCKVALVRMFTMSEYSHVAIAWRVGERVFVLEAVMPQVRNFPLSKCGDFYWLPIPAPKFDSEGLPFALACMGEEYSQSQAMQGFFHLPSEDDKWQCAEYVRAVALRSGFDLGPKATPTAVVRYAMASGCPSRLISNEGEK